MNYILKGSLNALVWDGCSEPFLNTTVKLYDVTGRKNLNDMLTAGEKKILVIDSEKVREEKKALILGQGKTDSSGNFEIKLNDEYKGEAFEVSVYCESVTDQKHLSNNHKPIEFVIATIQPSWQEIDEFEISYWKYVLPFGFWRYILSVFDVWVIYGKIVSSREPKTPIVGVEVKAQDADWISDNLLGTAYTDKLGYFRIYYSSNDFNKIHVSGENSELSSPDIHGGPDVYFTVKTSSGIVLIDETKVDGRKAERSNIGNCHCLTLSIREGRGGEINGMDSAWSGIGTTFAIPSGGDLNDFDAQGYAGIMKYAITGKFRLTGRKVHKVGPHPLEYRFLVSKSTGVNGASPLPESKFNLIVGKDPGLFVETKIGQMWRFAPSFKIVNIYARQADFDNEGWLNVNRAVERTFTEDPNLEVSELSDPRIWRWVDFDGMIALNTEALAVSDDVSICGITPGSDITLNERIPIEKIAIRFEIREVIDQVKRIYNYLPSSGQTLNALIVNNNRSVKLLGIKEQPKDKIDYPLTHDVHVLYTTYHPHLRDVSINIRKNNEIGWNGLCDVTVPLTSNNNPAINLCYNSNGIRIPQSLLTSSGTYIVMLYLTRRLHNGDEAVSTEWVDTSFVYLKQNEQHVDQDSFHDALTA